MNYDLYRGVLNADLAQNIEPSGPWEIPVIHRTKVVPDTVVPFDKAVSSNKPDSWIHFFIHDRQFSRLVHDPWRYLPIIARHAGAISPDFSVFWGYPRYKQLESVCRNREFGAWMQRNGITVIPSVRWGKPNTYDFAFEGIEPGGTVAVGTAGCMREKKERMVFEEGFGPMLEAVKPKTLIVYGSRRSHVFADAENAGVRIVQFDTATADYHAKAVN